MDWLLYVGLGAWLLAVAEMAWRRHREWKELKQLQRYVRYVKGDCGDWTMLAADDEESQ